MSLSHPQSWSSVIFKNVGPLKVHVDEPCSKCPPRAPICNEITKEERREGRGEGGERIEGEERGGGQRRGGRGKRRGEEEYSKFTDSIITHQSFTV